MVSAEARSRAQRKGSKRSSAALRSIWKNPKKKGSVIRMGMQPPSGFTLCFLNSSIVAACSFWGLSLNFSRTACISGWIFCMRLAEREAARVKGRNTILRSSVVRMIATPQFGTYLWTHVISVSRIWLKNLKNPNCITLSWSALKTFELERRRYSFGPT